MVIIFRSLAVILFGTYQGGLVIEPKYWNDCLNIQQDSHLFCNERNKHRLLLSAYLLANLRSSLSLVVDFKNQWQDQYARQERPSQTENETWGTTMKLGLENFGRIGKSLRRMSFLIL